MNIKRAQILSLSFLIMCVCCANKVIADTIIPDGNTNTILSVNGNVTNIDTKTIKGTVSFNSFSKFNISEGNIVNLHLPAATNSLINLVNSEASIIDGMVNCLKGNK